MPTSLTLLWPGADPLFPQDWADAVSAYYSHATVRPLESTGHFVPLEHPEAMSGAILDALGTAKEPTDPNRRP